jgi:hypothetical protein
MYAISEISPLAKNIYEKNQQHSSCATHSTSDLRRGIVVKNLQAPFSK